MKKELDEKFRGFLGLIDLTNVIYQCKGCHSNFIYGEAGPGDGTFYTLVSPHTPSLGSERVISNGVSDFTYTCPFCKIDFAVKSEVYKGDEEWNTTFRKIR